MIINTNSYIDIKGKKIMTLNQEVEGSNPSRPTSFTAIHHSTVCRLFFCKIATIRKSYFSKINLESKVEAKKERARPKPCPLSYRSLFYSHRFVFARKSSLQLCTETPYNDCLLQGKRFRHDLEEPSCAFSRANHIFYTF
jgi:hypothetical protein